MPQQEIEIILARQLASYVAVPIFIVDVNGSLLYYNEHAERILGYRFDQTGPMPLQEWATCFNPLGESGEPLEPEALPLVAALTSRRPGHRRFWIDGMDHVRRCIEVTALPLVGQSDRFLGAIAIFWEEEQ